LFNLKSLSLDIFNLSLITNTIQTLLTNFISMISSLNLHSLFTYNYIINLIPNFVNANFTFEKLSFLGDKTLNSKSNDNTTSVTFSTENSMMSDHSSQTNTFLSETSNNARFTRFNNPLISYDYKCGHYLGI
jgi:anionic cell wall polymer biosynthesis LytR-Cps2A-Psr (LCP) family protein